MTAVKVASDELRRRAEVWLRGDPDDGTRAELTAMLAGGNDAELVERFGRQLEFGTAGLRGLLGAGPNRMNRAVVIRTSLGFVRYLVGQVPDASKRGIVVGYDARRMSRTFAEDVAGVFAAAGVGVHWFDHVVPTPLVVFAVGALGAAGGVVITASHNPAGYNGYKVYGWNGAQIVPPHDEGIAAAIRAAPPAISVARESIDVARAEGRLVDLSDDLAIQYVEGVRGLMLSPHVRPSLSIVYTPLHGVGYPLFERTMAAAGFKDVSAVPEQVAPDPAFPTTPFPNPEEKGVLDLAVGLAQRQGADLVLANDPDADRLAVAVRNDRDEMVQLSGNQVGVLLGHYVLTEDRGGGDRAVISTIVSSPMLGEIARDLGVHYDETLTGFKWIAARALELESQGKRFLFGYEEALGYALGDRVRDKDGISAAVLFAELASVCEERGTTVLTYLSNLYRQFGYHASMQKSITLEGTEGARRIERMMSELRSHPPDRIAGRRILERRDYRTRERTVLGGPSEPLSLPSSDVLAYELEGHGRVIVRPSGTEPKLKFYLDHREQVAPGEPLNEAEARAARELARIEDALGVLSPP